MGERALRGGAASGLVVAMSWTLMGQARAAPPTATTVVVMPATCASLPWEPSAWVELLKVELAADGIAIRLAPVASPDDEVHIMLDATPCDAAATSATLSFAAGSVTQSRAVDLRDIAAVARPRVLAIAMADLVRSGLAAARPREPGLPSPPAELLVRVALSTPPETPRAPAPPRVGFFAAAETRVFAQGSALFGARAGVLVPLDPRLVLGLDGGVLAGSAYDTLGDIETTVGTLGASLHATGEARGASFGVGPRIEGGLGWFRSHAGGPLTLAASATTGLAFLSMSAAASFPVAGSLAGYVGLDAGTTLYGFSARADDRHVLDVSGALLALRVGFLFRRPEPEPQARHIP